MYAVSEKYREKIYSGGALHRASLTINGEPIPNSNIKKITISSPLIDTTTDYFYIGTFIAQKVEIQFKNANDINLNGPVTLTIDTKISEPSGNPEEETYNDGYEVVPIGNYIIDTSPEDYFKSAKITCYDKSVLFKKNVDISQWLDENGEITAEQLLIELCNYFLGENMLGTYPELHRNLKIGSYDNTLSGKSYISQIAEIMASNAKMGRDGKLYLIPLKQTPAVKINAKKGKSWTLKEVYKISGVNYENLDGITMAGTKDNNVLYIRGTNFFLNGTIEHRQNIINSIYEQLKDFEIYAVKQENYGDPSLDCWDIIEFELDDKVYYVFNENTLTYEMNIATVIENTIPSKQVQEITNNIKEDTLKINKIENEIDQVNGRVTTTLTRVEGVESDLKENYYEKTTTNQLIQDVQKGIINIFSQSGGYNLLVNTAPYRIISETQLENWNGNIGSTSETESASKFALKLLSGTVSQTVKITSDITYAIGFKYKRLINGATLKITYNGREIVIDSEDNITYNDNTNLTNENNEITSFGIIKNDNFTIQFECSADGGFEIYELRLVYGEVTLPWSQNQNEFKSTSVNIGDGITIESEQANTVNTLDTYGMIVKNKTTNTNTLKVTDTGIESDGDLLIAGKTEISGMLIQRINKKHVFVTGIVEE